jgi:hypothetical protein
MSTGGTWTERNRAYVWSEIERIRKCLAGQAGEPASWELEREPALVTLRNRFRLSPFEYDVVVLCAGYALEPTFAAGIEQPTFSLALAKLGGHLDATIPTAPLRRYRLVTLHGADSALHARLTLDDRIVHFVLGIDSVDDQLLPYLLPLPAQLANVTATHERLAQQIASGLRRAEPGTVVQLIGAHPLTRLAVLRSAAAAAGICVLRLRGNSLALPPVELDKLQRMLEREMLLSQALAVVELDTLDAADSSRTARMFVVGLSGLIVISASEPLPIAQASGMLFEVPHATTAERRSAWESALGPHAPEMRAQLDRISHQFRLDVAEIADIARAADPANAEALGDQCWRLCLERSRPRIEDLARCIKPSATWDDLVVPAAVIGTLREVVTQLRYRHAVHEQWGFARGDSRGQAITALFAGPSGTGKTLAAEVIAHETSLDLYHVDLSQVVDKYVGETEKRLRRIFDAAEAGGAVLLFDEADALFGKRAQVERGTDRWANIEVSYLLQRMESYNGLAILTTNAKDALDAAFLRRLRFVVQFPFPDVRLRTELWRRVIPPDAPRGALDIGKLARLQLTGANIKGIAINAAFHAASEQTPLTMQHLVRAARSEFAKLEQPFPEADVRGWQLGGS